MLPESTLRRSEQQPPEEAPYMLTSAPTRDIIKGVIVRGRLKFYNYMIDLQDWMLNQ